MSVKALHPSKPEDITAYRFSIERRAKSHNALSSALSASRKLNAGTEENGAPSVIGSVILHSLHEKIHSLVARSQELVKMYVIMSSKVVAEGGILHMNHEGNTDLQRLQTLLDIGKAVTEDQIGGLLVQSSKDKLTERLKFQHNGEIWARLLQVEVLGKSHKSWAASARRTKKCISRLVKHVHFV